MVDIEASMVMIAAAKGLDGDRSRASDVHGGSNGNGIHGDGDDCSIHGGLVPAMRVVVAVVVVVKLTMLRREWWA